MGRVKTGILHRRGCEYIQEWMQTVSEYTEDDANGFFGGGWASAGLTVQWAGKRLGWTNVEVGCRNELTLK
jgi:hypothetical protein